ncbi:MAG TPA: 3-hydroxyacyl-ACP dehydratase FabZ [Kiritimatiellia bacterium]|nr:3-hydroxyacyl-ACP dehydratase FabZ [Kiritimatiellia bacterium]
MSEMQIKEIMSILPHRYPMLLVDRVIECDFKQRIVAIKNLSATDPCFQGHFPGDPVFPGVLQLEAMAQVGGILMNKAFGFEGRVAYFLAVDNARFRRVVRPGDQLRIEVEFQRARLGMSKMSGKIFCGEELVSEAQIMFGYGDA